MTRTACRTRRSRPETAADARRAKHLVLPGGVLLDCSSWVDLESMADEAELPECGGSDPHALPGMPGADKGGVYEPDAVLLGRESGEGLVATASRCEAARDQIGGAHVLVMAPGQVQMAPKGLDDIT